jgi:hypothetical protein
VFPSCVWFLCIVSVQLFFHFFDFKFLYSPPFSSKLGPYSLLKEPVENGVFLSVLKSVAAPLHDTYYLKSSGDTNLDKANIF